MRPKKLAEDNTPDLPVLLHLLNWLKKNESYLPDYIVHLRVTSPLRCVKHIDESIKKLADDKNADSIRGVCIPNQTPYKMWEIQGRYMKPLLKIKNIKEPYNTPRQLLPKIYWQNGHIEVIRYSTIINKRSMTGGNIIPYIMGDEYIIDIDSIEDVKLAEIIIKKGKKN